MDSQAMLASYAASQAAIRGFDSLRPLQHFPARNGPNLTSLGLALMSRRAAHLAIANEQASAMRKPMLGTLFVLAG